MRRRCKMRFRKNAANGWSGGYEGFFRLDTHADFLARFPSDGGLGLLGRAAFHGSILCANGRTLPAASGGFAVPPSDAAGGIGRNRRDAAELAPHGIYFPHVTLRLDADLANARGITVEHHALGS